MSTARQTQYPRLFVTPDGLSALRDRLQQEPFAPRWQGLKDHAESSLHRPAPAGNPRSSLGVAGSTAFVYLVTGEERFGQRARRELLAMLEADRWHRGYHWNRGADLGTAERCVAAALVWDWCNDLFTGAERRRVVERVVELGIQPYLTSVEGRTDWWVDNYVTNWCGVVHGGCGLAGLAFSAESAPAGRAADHAWPHLQKFLRNVILEDGGGHEGVMYWRYGVEFANYFVTAAARRRGGDGGLFETYAEKMAGYWDIYMQGPDRRYANFNDMNEFTYYGLWGDNTDHGEGGPRAALCALFEAQVPGGDELLLWGADNGAGKFYWRGTSPFYFFWRRQAPPAGPKPELQKAALFRGAGHAILRSPGLWVAFNGGWTSDRSHNNRDLGTFVLVAGRERFVSDPGYGLNETAQHSTLLVGGRGQPRGVSGDYRRFGRGDGFSWLACDLSECYPGTALERWVRHVVMVDGVCVVLLDDLRAAEPTAFETRLQSRLPVEADAASRRATVSGKATDLHVLVVSPHAIELSAEESVMRRRRRRGREFQTIRTETEETTAATVVTVLYPATEGEEPPRVAFDETGRLRVRAEDRDDRIAFERTEGGWTLVSVNGASAAGIGTGEKRVLKAFRPADR